MSVLPIKLYHGTSTIFLDSILGNGLGGTNFIDKWKLKELSRTIYQLSNEHLHQTRSFQLSSYSFKRMTEQANDGSLNWQHGHTYLSASKATAINYALTMRYGSELLSYTLKFLKALKEFGIPDIIEQIRVEYNDVFNLLYIQPSPILISISDVLISKLSNEKGEDCSYNLERINEHLHKDDIERQSWLQQCNFRLESKLNVSDFNVQLIGINGWSKTNALYNLYDIKTK